jgi:alkylhydroperoxidase/carboxymuconolactone decarboxylase family protein YurZ
MWMVRSPVSLVSGCGDDSIRGGLRGHRSQPRQARTMERKYAMSTPAKADVDDVTKDALNGLALGDVDMLERGLELREAWQAQSGLDPRAFSLVKIAALIAVDAPPASYLWQVSNALDAGATPNEILGVMRAIAPQVGGPRVVAAAPEIMVALGLSLPPGGDFD